MDPGGIRCKKKKKNSEIKGLPRTEAQSQQPNTTGQNESVEHREPRMALNMGHTANTVVRLPSSCSNWGPGPL